MSMLAEPKCKKKWSLNPRGKLWSNDDTKLGQKLLEKMGWSKGKGLGRDEQGDLEPVRLKYKNDAEGVGYVAKDDQWIAHHEEFNAILGKLNGSEGPAPLPETVPVKSLEVRSKVSKARVHYHKFTRGKDLSRYSESDLASILGKRANNSNPSSDDEKTVEMKTEFDEEVPENVEVKEKVNESTTDEEHSHGVTTINKGNIHEYFAAKMAALKGKQVAQPAENTSEMTNQDVLNAEKRVRINEDLNQVKEFCSKKRITEWSQETLAKSTDSSDSDTEKKKEKSKKKSKSKSTEAGEAVILDCCANQKDMEPPKSKKRKLEHEVSEPESEQMTPKKKRKKKEDKDNQENCPPVKANEEALAEMNQQKKKKKCTAEDTSDEVNEIKKNKKKKKKGKSDEDAEITQQTEAAEPSETGEPAKKKKKRNKSETVVAGSAETANQSDHPEAAETEPKKMKMKRGQSEDEDSCNAASSDEVTSTPDAENQETSGMKKKKKKKKKKKNKKDVSEDSAPDAEAAPQAPQRETQSDRLAEMNDLPGTAEQASAQKTDSGAPSDPSGTENNYPVPDFSFIDKPSKVKESIVKYQKASFEMFKGSNLFSLVGYGNSS